MTKLNRPLAFTHALTLALGLLLLYGWMLSLPFFADALYLTSSRHEMLSPGYLVQLLDPRVDPATQEATRVTPLYRPAFLEVVVPLVQRLFRGPGAVYGLVLAVGWCAALAVYGLSFRLSRCQHSALVVAAFVAFHPALFEAYLAGFAGLNGPLTYLLVALALACLWALVERPGRLALAGLLGCAALAVFTWERVSLLAIGLPLLLIWATLAVRPPARLRELAPRVAHELRSRRVLIIMVAGALITGAYFLARAARFGAPFASHHGTATTLGDMARLAGALLLGAVGIIPPYVGAWFGTSFVELSLSSRLVFLVYALTIVGLVIVNVRARPAVASLGLVVGGLLLLPNFSATGVQSIRYADLLVLGLAITLSAAPLAPAITGERRFWLGLAAVVPLLLVAALFQATQIGSPNHYLVRSARLASAVRDTAAAATVLTRERPLLLMGGFFNREPMWIFNATPSRLGAFFDANFGVSRERVRRFTPAALAGGPRVLVDYYFEADGATVRPVGVVEVVRSLRPPSTVRWESQAAFPCQGGDVLAVTSRQAAEPPAAGQYLRVIFNRSGGSGYAVLEPFGPFQEVTRDAAAAESQLYALVPPGTDTCQVLTDGLAAGSAVTRVERLRHEA